MTTHSGNLKIRSDLIRSVRNFFHSTGYLEVDTPIMGPAIIPEAHIDPFSMEDDVHGQLFLQASPELYMKRLLAEKFREDDVTGLFQICKCFRKGERSPRHVPEMTMLEWYGKDQTYLDLMEQCQNLVRYIARQLHGKDTLEYQGKTIELSQPWERIPVEKAFEMYAEKPMGKALEEGDYDEIMAFEIEPNLGLKTPCFLFDYPPSLASLAALKPDNPNAAQRCELYIAGIELANGFTELSDPAIQKKRFAEENQIRVERGMSALPLPDNFLSSLENLPPCAGIALGIDRLVMLFCNCIDIDDSISFTPENQ